jgi:hypothetical protein
MPLRRFASIGGVLLGLALTVAGAAWAQSDPTTVERRVKAAFLYKFADYVEWPSAVFVRADEPLTIAVMGDDPLGDELAQIVKDRTLRGRGVEVRKLKEEDPVAGVQVLFVGRGRVGALHRSAVHASPILVVTDAAGALAQGSTINFVLSDDRVRFEVSVEDAERRGLKLSSRLLTVAQNVHMGKP